ncbi:hypothetical protein [Streptomyces sp. H39-C1]|uniref:hypothetical protein n=1 Tax=Streptomyces sp. H39-C1 TaxID=3004355 RepID=UPI0022AE547A|nr:hypothetical protein [Streptomyces sp. H39-C1]MCZ4099861.1 hypothetical protein [Streptomyces sp. H39-C1]
MTATQDPDQTRVWLTRLSLGAGIAFTASAEYQLARTLGASPAVATMLPVAIDAYVVAALRWFRSADIALSLALMGAAQVAAHLLDAHVMAVNVPMVVIVSLLVPVAIWRTHALARRKEPTEEFSPVAEPTGVLVERVAPAPVIKVPVAVPHLALDKGYKGPLPTRAELPPVPEPELTAAALLARNHKVRPDQIRAVAALLAEQPALSGRSVGDYLGTTDRYGRRVLAAAKELGGRP